MPVNENGLIDQLDEGEIFVFGSNMAGRHGAGAALQARLKFGAIYGIGEGFTGQCYALPTLNSRLEQLSDYDLQLGIDIFLEIARGNPKLTFLLTKVGCGLAGYDETYIKDKFKDVPPNVILPQDWIEKCGRVA